MRRGVPGIKKLCLNPVEAFFLKESQKALCYQQEKIASIETLHSRQLGKFTALSFIFWAQLNPKSVIALPTGKTPEYFIKYLQHFKKHWTEERPLLHSLGIDAKKFPSFSQNKLIQIDEFIPILGHQKNSFQHFVRHYYQSIFEMEDSQLLMMDTSQFDTQGLANPSSKNNRKLLAYCKTFENKILDWGGIGFFLGGIGPDGHFAFNMPNQNNFDKACHFERLNESTKATCAGDAGGISQVQDWVITLGPQTLKKSEALQGSQMMSIIFATGHAKASIVKQAVCGSFSNAVPASFFQKLSSARFYLSESAASQLPDRQLERLRNNCLNKNDQEQILLQASQQKNKIVQKLTQKDLSEFPAGKILSKKSSIFGQKFQNTLQNFKHSQHQKIERGLSALQGIGYHTAPHHDDIMLSYYPILKRLLKNEPQQHIMYATSGFTAVANDFLESFISGSLQQVLFKQNPHLIFNEEIPTIISKVKIPDTQLALTCLFLRKVAEQFHINHLEGLHTLLKKQLEALIHANNSKDLFLIKGILRESEAELMWYSLGLDPKNYVRHLRLKFYQGSLFNPKPPLEDIQRVQAELARIRPDFITVAYDPEATGPDTHFKVLYTLSEALRMLKQEPNFSGYEPSIWCYRNVWFHFELAESTMILPMLKKELLETDNVFMACFLSQSKAEFPSYKDLRPFSKSCMDLYQKQLQTCQKSLGRSYFETHSNSLLKNAAGMIFIQNCSLAEFLENTQTLQERLLEEC